MLKIDVCVPIDIHKILSEEYGEKYDMASVIGFLLRRESEKIKQEKMEIEKTNNKGVKNDV